MKKLIGLNLDVEVIEKLRESSNMSGKANQVLKDYFAIEKPIHELLEEKKQIIETELKELNEIQTKAEEINKEKEKITEQLKAQEEAKYILNESERLEKLKANQKEFFDLYDVPKEQQEALFEEYWDALINGRVQNLKMFMSQREIEKKVKFSHTI